MLLPGTFLCNRAKNHSICLAIKRSLRFLMLLPNVAFQYYCPCIGFGPYGIGARLLASWNFKKMSETKVEDASGNGVPLLYFPGIKIQDGVMILGGSKFGAIFPDFGYDFNWGNGATIACWVKPYQMIVGAPIWEVKNSLDPSSSESIYLTLLLSDEDNFAVLDGSYLGRKSQLLTKTEILENVRTFMAVTVDGTHAAIYLDGEISNSGFFNIVLKKTSNNYIGSSYNREKPRFQGTMEDFRIFDRELTPPEVKQLYELGK